METHPSPTPLTSRTCINRAANTRAETIGSISGKIFSIKDFFTFSIHYKISQYIKEGKSQILNKMRLSWILKIFFHACLVLICMFRSNYNSKFEKLKTNAENISQLITSSCCYDRLLHINLNLHFS